MTTDKDMLVTLTAEIVLAHVGNNTTAVENVSGVIKSVYATLEGLGAPVAVEETRPKPRPAVSIRASIKPTHIVSMIDGKPYSMLKRHLTGNGYTPQTYREAFGLPADYPMVSAAYAEKRRALAHKIGLGSKAKPVEPPKPARKPRAKKAEPAAKKKLGLSFQGS